MSIPAMNSAPPRHAHRHWNETVFFFAGLAIGVLLGATIAVHFIETLKAPEMAQVASFLQIVVSVFLLGGTGVLAWETISARLERIAPHVVCTVEPHPKELNHIQFVVENVGTGTARHVEVTLTPPLKYTMRGKEETVPDDFKFLKKIDILKPGQAIRHGMTSHETDGVKFFETKQTKAQVTCEDVSGRKHSTETHIDIYALIGMRQLEEGTELRKVAAAVDKIAQALTQYPFGLHVDVFDKEDRAKHEADMEKVREEIAAERRTRKAAKNAPDNMTTNDK